MCSNPYWFEFYLYQDDPNLIIFEDVVPIFPSTKLFRQRFEERCSAQTNKPCWKKGWRLKQRLGRRNPRKKERTKKQAKKEATKFFEEKVQQHDENAESSKTGCRSPSWQGNMAKHMSKCLHWSETAMPAAYCAQLPFGGLFCSYGANNPPKYLGNKSKIAHWNSPSIYFKNLRV